MVSNEDFIQGFLPTVLTTPRSDSILLFRVSIISQRRYTSRAALATIRNLGDYPCPRCLIPLSLAHNFGTSEDRQDRINKARIDDTHRRTKISKARKLIYGKLGAKKNTNMGVTSAAVERLLKDQSLVPTSVCSPIYKTKPYLIFDIL